MFGMTEFCQPRLNIGPWEMAQIPYKCVRSTPSATVRVTEYDTPRQRLHYYEMSFITGNIITASFHHCIA